MTHEGAPVQPETPEEFLANRGIESLAGRMVAGHDGQPVPLSQALAECPRPVQAMIDSSIDLIRDMTDDAEDIVPRLAKQLDRMGERAQP
jgi:hypothetical protein